MCIKINSQTIDTFVFSGGESHVRLDPTLIGCQVELHADLHQANDIMNLLLTVDAIRRVNPVCSINLTIVYFPYARQDRVCNPGEALSIRVMADLINNLHCATVTIFDPHSDVTPALLNNCIVKTSADIISESALADFIHQKQLSLMSPDAGAEKKVIAVAKKLAPSNKGLNILTASKQRDTITGEIKATTVHGDFSEKNILIIDDICDGGRTFTSLAKQLKQKGAGELYLYVTHGIFSKGIDSIIEDFEHIFCYHSLNEQITNSKFISILQTQIEQ